MTPLLKRIRFAHPSIIFLRSAVLRRQTWCLLGPRARRGDDATEEQPPAIKDSIGATKHPQTIRTSYL